MKKNEINLINNTGHLIIIICFLAPLYIFLVISILDKDKEISEKENRVLSSVPEFSLSSLFEGTYTQDYETYYSDTFPLRDIFLTANTKLTALYTNTYQDKMSLVATNKKEDFAGESLRSVSGNVNNTQISNASEDDINEDTSSENTTLKDTTEEELPLPENADPSKIEDLGAILIVDTRAMELYTNIDSMLVSYADLVSTLQSKVPGVQVFDMVAPTSIEFYSPEEYHTGSSSQKDGINTIYSSLQNGVLGVDVYSELRKHIDEYIYFRTDHHWTAKGAYYAYVAFSEIAGFDAVDIDSLEYGRLDDFVGTMHMYTQSEVLKQNPDYVEYFLPNTETTAMVYDDASMTNGFEISVITQDIQSGNKYLTFIEGDNPLTHIKTGVQNGKKIMVIKESYGNSLVPFLCNNYEEVYVVDPRRIDMYLPDFVAQNGIDQILCVNYMFAPTNPTYIEAFTKIIGE